MSSKTKLLIGAAGIVGGVGIWLLTRKPPVVVVSDVRVDDVIIHDPSGRRIIVAGDEIRLTVTFTNVGEEAIAPRLRVSIWDGTTPIEGEWVRAVAEPEVSATLDVWRDIPTNWGPGEAVTIRLDIEGIPDDPVNRQWNNYFDIVAEPSIEDIVDAEISYSRG